VHKQWKWRWIFCFTQKWKGSTHKGDNSHFDIHRILSASSSWDPASLQGFWDFWNLSFLCSYSCWGQINVNWLFPSYQRQWGEWILHLSSLQPLLWLTQFSPMMCAVLVPSLMKTLPITAGSSWLFPKWCSRNSKFLCLWTAKKPVFPWPISLIVHEINLATPFSSLGEIHLLSLSNFPINSWKWLCKSWRAGETPSPYF
jgi:hypothetical protein